MFIVLKLNKLFSGYELLLLFTIFMMNDNICKSYLVHTRVWNVTVDTGDSTHSPARKVYFPGTTN